MTMLGAVVACGGVATDLFPGISRDHNKSDGVTPTAVYSAIFAYGTVEVMELGWCFGMLLLRLCRYPRCARQRHELRLFPGILVGLSLLYPGVWKSMLSVVSCTTLRRRGRVQIASPDLWDASVPVDTTDRVLRWMEQSIWSEQRMEADFTIKCWTGVHLVWVLTWLLPIACGIVGVLLGGWWLALRSRYTVNAVSNLASICDDHQTSGRRWKHTVQEQRFSHHQQHRHTPFAFLYQGIASNRRYWGLVHIVLILVQLTGMVLSRSLGSSAPAAWAMLVALIRLCPSIQWRPYHSFELIKPSDSEAAVDWLHMLDVACGCALVASATSFLYMSGGGYSVLKQGRGLTCEAAIVAASVVVCASECSVLCFAVWVWCRTRE